MHRCLLGMSTVCPRRCVDLDLVRVERSRFDAGALALLSVEIPGVMSTRYLRLYRNGQTGEPFVGGVPLTGPRGRLRRSPLTLHGGVQELCTGLARATVKDSVLEEYGDLVEAPIEYAWLDDAEHEARFGRPPRNDGIVFEAIERVDRLREHPTERGTWMFRLSLAGLGVGDGVVIDGCEVTDLNAEFPTVLAPPVPRSDDRYARIFPESARRIAEIIRETLDRAPTPFGAATG